LRLDLNCNNMENFGVLQGNELELRPEIWLCGGSTGIIDDITVNDWTPYLPENERQSRYNLDSMGCVSFSACNTLETLFNYYYINDLLSVEDRVWLKEKGYIVNGKINFSDRFIAKMSGTTENGNYFYIVGDTIRKSGLVPESSWGWNEPFNWDQYYSEVSEEVVDLGLQFAERFKINYEFVSKNDLISEALTHSPLQVGVYAWANENGEYVFPEGKSANHGVENFKVWDIFDTYDPFIKKLKEGYHYGSVVKYKVTFNDKPMRFLKEKHSEHIYLIVGNKKIMIIDIPTLNILKGKFEEVDSLSQFIGSGTLVWNERIIE